jgi:hypothetical protein
VNGGATVVSVSCASTGNCSAGGSYTDGSGRLQAFVVDEIDGTWGNAEEVPGLEALNAGGNASIVSLSCPLPGNCGACGYYRDGSDHFQAFVVNRF